MGCALVCTGVHWCVLVCTGVVIHRHLSDKGGLLSRMFSCFFLVAHSMSSDVAETYEEVAAGLVLELVLGLDACMLGRSRNRRRNQSRKCG